jgi:hypothetical protein
MQSNQKYGEPNVTNSRSQWPRGRWDCGFESHREHGCLSVVSVVCCQVEVSATSWSHFQRSPTDRGASSCVIYKPREWGDPGPLGRAVPNKQVIMSHNYYSNKMHTFIIKSTRYHNLYFMSCILPLHVSPRVGHLQGAQCQCLAKVIINYNLLKLC